MRRRTLLAAMVLLWMAMYAVPARGAPTRAMQNAVDTYAADYASFQGWRYVDRLADSHGDWRRSRFTLVFVSTGAGRYDGHSVKVDFEWNIEARVARCGPGWYVVSTPYDLNSCQRKTAILPHW
jgi:hypothetical protein